MGFLSNLFGNQQNEAFGDSCVEAYYKRYEESVKKEPYSPPVVHLWEMWVGHFGRDQRANKKLLDPGAVKALMSLYGCVPHPNGGIALAFYMLSVEHPGIVNRYPKYEAKCAELIGEVIALDQAKNWSELNKRFNAVNAGLQLQSPFPIISDEHREIATQLGLLKPE